MSEAHIFLIGPMGAGKSTIGRQLADFLCRPFIDVDNEIETMTGADIQWIFDMEGEEGFRKRETKMLQDLCEISNIVIATGGGIIIKEENRALLKRDSFVVYLSSSIEQLVKRTANSKARPLLEQSNNREKTIRDLVAAREGFYQEVADVVIDTTGKKLYVIINEIKKSILKWSVFY